MKSYHVYKIKNENQAIKVAGKDGKENKYTKPEIVKIGLVDYVFNENTGEFIPFEEMYTPERRPK